MKNQLVLVSICPSSQSTALDEVLIELNMYYSIDHL